MIINPEIIKNKYGCSRKIMEYLVYDCRLSVLGYSKNGKVWYFTDNDKLQECLKNMPFHLKILAFFKNKS